MVNIIVFWIAASMVAGATLLIPVQMRPKRWGWLGFVALCLLWPILFLYFLMEVCALWYSILRNAP